MFRCFSCVLLPMLPAMVGPPLHELLGTLTAAAWRDQDRLAGLAPTWQGSARRRFDARHADVLAALRDARRRAEEALAACR